MSSKVDAAEGKRILAKLSERLAAAGYTEEDIGRISRIGGHETGMKLRDDQGVDRVEIVEQFNWQLAPSWDEDPKWPVVAPAAPVKMRPAKTKPRAANSLRRTIILPDPQIGFWKNQDTGDMIPMQDEAALDVALAIARHIKPDSIVNLGDQHDFAEWSSKFTVHPEFAFTTQATLNRSHEFLCAQREITDDVTLIEGNHDARIVESITRNTMAAARLRRAGDPPDSWPIFSLPFMLRLDDIGVNYVGAYPAGQHKIAAGNDEQSPLYAIHGQILDLRKVAERERQSYVQGHTHHQALFRKSYEIDGRPWLVWAFSPGCLCRIDGFVPSVRGGAQNGQPVTRYEDWHQGVAIVTEYDDGSWVPEIIPIHRGRAVYGGRTFDSDA